MKKIIITLIAFVLFLHTTYWFDGDRSCNTKYSTINWIQYFSWIHCTEKIKLTWVFADKTALRDVSVRVVNDFIIANNYKIIQYLEWSWSCDTINTLEDITLFENVIYSNNDISYTTTTANIETLTIEIDDLIEDYNAEDLYDIVFEEIKVKYPLWSLDFLRLETRNSYFDRQLDIKNEILDKQKEKLTFLYKLTESQKFIEWFYEQINNVCKSYEDEYWNKELIEEENDEEKKEILIEKYKEEFNVKLWSKLDSLPRQVLESLSVKLLSYAETSPVFKKFTVEQKELVKLKIIGLKRAIDDRLE